MWTGHLSNMEVFQNEVDSQSVSITENLITMMSASALICLFISVTAATALPDTLSINAWQSEGKYPTASDFPESKLPELTSRPNTGIAFSGGGSRSYGASIGYLSALSELGLMDNVRYIGGMSGGSWATTVYTYGQNITDDIAYLGPIVDPEDIVYDDIKKMQPDCVRGLVSDEFSITALKALKDNTVDSIAEGWVYALSKQYFEPVGIPAATRFSWSVDTVADIKKRNPELKDEQFLLPTNSKRPFMILGAAIVGPSEDAPFTTEAQNFTMMDFTPLYSGQMYTMDVSYNKGNKILHKKHVNTETKRIGGVIESFSLAPGSQVDIAPKVGLKKGKSSDVLTIPTPSRFLDLEHAAGASGYAPGAFFESSHIPDFADKAGMHFSYWSPTERVTPEVTDMLVTDGGCYSDTPMISYLQRKVEKIVLFLNHHQPLLPAEDWNVTDPNVEPSADQIDRAVQSYFGVFPSESSVIYDRSYMVEKNQVFSKNDYSKVILALQAAQAEGNGIIANFNLTTVENEWWGIPAGFEVDITFVYLGRLGAWEKKLSEDMQSRVVPDDGNPDDMSNTRDHGIFRNFPHYYTAGGLMTSQQINLLADMTGWSVKQNKELFTRIFS